MSNYLKRSRRCESDLMRKTCLLKNKQVGETVVAPIFASFSKVWQIHLSQPNKLPYVGINKPSVQITKPTTI